MMCVCFFATSAQDNAERIKRQVVSALPHNNTETSETTGTYIVSTNAILPWHVTVQVTREEHKVLTKADFKFQ